MNLKPFSLGILLVLFSTSAHAQYWYAVHELTIGIGAMTSDAMFDGNRVKGSSGPYLSYGNHYATGSFYLDYKYAVSRTFTIGMFTGFEKESGDLVTPDLWEDNSPYMLGTFSRTAYTIGAEMSVVYGREKDLRCYGTAGIGATYEQETDVFQQQYYNNARQYLEYSGPLTGRETVVPNNRIHINGYISPIGISYWKRINISFELGVGYKGIVNGGLSYKFGKGKYVQLPVLENKDKFEKGNAKQQPVSYVELIIFRDDSNNPFWNSSDQELIINDTCKLVIADNSKYIIKIPVGIEVIISNHIYKLFSFVPQKDQVYYLKAYAGNGRMKVKAINDKIAKMRSNGITDAHHIQL